MLIDPARPAATAAMLAELADHLKLPSGFADDATRQPALARAIDVGVRLVEERTRQALLQRSMTLRLTAWDGAGRALLPRAPAQAVEAVELDDGEGARASVDPALWRLEVDGARFFLSPRAGRALPPPPRDGFAEVRFVAGHGADWAEVPQDLRHAAVLLSADCYEGRGADAALSAVRALLEPYRELRL